MRGRIKPHYHSTTTTGIIITTTTIGAHYPNYITSKSGRDRCRCELSPLGAQIEKEISIQVRLIHHQNRIDRPDGLRCDQIKSRPKAPVPILAGPNFGLISPPRWSHLVEKN